VLPESPEQLKKRGLVPLFDAAENVPYTVSCLHERDPKLLIFLHRSGIGPNARVQLRARNYDETVTIETPSGTITLGRPAAERVWVKRRKR
jgi:DtxR family transcriptional regulator, Mn-dependent transcriptional regulator